jgi:hypothetical protein
LLSILSFASGLITSPIMGGAQGSLGLQNLSRGTVSDRRRPDNRVLRIFGGDQPTIDLLVSIHHGFHGETPFEFLAASASRQPIDAPNRGDQIVDLAGDISGHILSHDFRD